MQLGDQSWREYANDDYWQTYWDLNKRVKESIEAAGLTIPFPQRSLHIISGTERIADRVE